MNMEEALQRAESLLQPIAGQLTRPAPYRLDAVVSCDALPAAVAALRDARWGYLAAITGLDLAPPAPQAGEATTEGGVEALYHFCEGAAVTTLRVTVPYSAAAIPSICHLVPSATLYEREFSEMLGVTVVGTPDPDHLLLDENWPAGVYPLRKSFKGKVAEA